MSWVESSIFDLYKIGPGPSSSHTIGPMRAANEFLKALQTPESAPDDPPLEIEIHFYGSLALTGKGHGSDRAAVAGLLGETPEQCDTELLAGLLSPNGPKHNEITLENGGKAVIATNKIFFHKGKHPYPYQNTIRLCAGSLEKVYFSIGGGFIREDGMEEETASPELIYRYASMDGFRKILQKHQIAPHELLIANEIALSGQSEAEIRAGIRRRIAVMTAAVERGLNHRGTLPGILQVERRAASVREKARLHDSPGSELLLIDAFALAAAEENAAGSLIVTAPTSGSSGILPALLYYCRNHRHFKEVDLENALITAAVIGLIARHNASISGAEVGCQGEIGVAAAMGAAFLAAAGHCPMERIECAAEIGLEHHLGLSCDPVAGYVQIPCIERNAVGAVTACNAFLLAEAGGGGSNKVSFDEALAAMYQTGRKMSTDLKETSQAGLARCCCCI